MFLLKNFEKRILKLKSLEVAFTFGCILLSIEKFSILNKTQSKVKATSKLFNFKMC